MVLDNFRRKVRNLPMKARIPIGLLGLSVIGGFFYPTTYKPNFGIPEKSEIREEYGGVTIPPEVKLDFKMKNNKLENIIEDTDRPESFNGSSNRVENNNYGKFTHPDEVKDILKQSDRIGVEPELMMAIRMAENGRDDLAYGIIPQGVALERYNSDNGYGLGDKFFKYSGEKEKQLCWSAWTVKKNHDRFLKDNEGEEDFISYLADKYAPVGVENDSDGLNKNWENNVRLFYDELKGEN